MKYYRHLFFDLDHTLWDYDTNVRETLIELYDQYELDRFGITSGVHFSDTFFRVNNELWRKLDIGEINKFYLRNHRFRLVFEAAKANKKSVKSALLMEINDSFLRLCPRKKKLIKGALELLDHLCGSFDMHIITNGFLEIQTVKMKSSGLYKYFDKVITSEKADHKKPSDGIFKYAIKHSRANLEQSIMIGDNLQTDIKGARLFGMDQVFFNPENINHDQSSTFEISELSNLLPILESGQKVKNS